MKGKNRLCRTNLAVMFFFVTLILFSACRSNKAVTEKGVESVENKAKISELKSLFKQMTGIEHFSSKIKINVEVDDKNISLSGNIKIEKNKAIIISVSAFGLFEVARVEFFPEKVIIINRAEKKYSEAAYSQFPILNETGINFYILQSLLLNEAFLPDGKNVYENLSSFHAKQTDDVILLAGGEKSRMAYNFYISASTHELTKTVGRWKEKTGMVCDYERFELFDKRNFPRLIKMSATGVDKKMNLSFYLSSMKNDRFDMQYWQPSSSYKRILIEELIKDIDKSI